LGAGLLAGTVVALGLADRRGRGAVWIDLKRAELSRA
jgi:hypothetical protein